MPIDSQSDFQKALDFCFGMEGGWGDDPVDRGGETIFGIARNIWPMWEGWAIVDAAPTSSDKRALKRSDFHGLVEAFYHRFFWCVPQYALLPSPLGWVCFDAAVNCGPGWSSRALQLVVGAYPDGAIGPMTLAAVAAHGDISAVGRELLDARRTHYLGIIQRDPSQERFKRGWMRRVTELQAAVGLGDK